MREIKVKAWDEERKSFFTSPKWVEFSVDINGVLSAKNINMQGKYQFLEIVRDTGMPDRNGKEIWEGYIVKDYMNRIYEVKFIQGCFCASRGCSEIYALNDFIYQGKMSLEVIGNRFENPELLKGE
jgi:hypothetical protein